MSDSVREHFWQTDKNRPHANNRQPPTYLYLFDKPDLAQKYVVRCLINILCLLLKILLKKTFSIRPEEKEKWKIFLYWENLLSNNWV